MLRKKISYIKRALYLNIFTAKFTINIYNIIIYINLKSYCSNQSSNIKLKVFLLMLFRFEQIKYVSILIKTKLYLQKVIICNDKSYDWPRVVTRQTHDIKKRQVGVEMIEIGLEMTSASVKMTSVIIEMTSFSVKMIWFADFYS